MSNSSLQIQDADGQFHLFIKYDLLSVERSPVPSMPSDYRNKLSTVEIEDLVELHRSTIAQVQATNSRSISHKKKNQME